MAKTRSSAAQSSKKTGRKMATQYRCTLNTIHQLCTDIKQSITPAHTQILERTPFKHMFKALLNEEINMDKKSNSMLDTVLNRYNKTKQSFRIGGGDFKPNRMDIKLIFGIEDGTKIVGNMNAHAREESTMAQRLFSNVDRLKAVHLKDALKNVVKKTDKRSIEDTVRLMCLILFQTVFFSNTGQYLNCGFLYYVEDLKRLSSFDWSTHIIKELYAALNKSWVDPRKVHGCTCSLLYWICEHSKIIKTRFEDDELKDDEQVAKGRKQRPSDLAIPRLKKWNLKNLENLITLKGLKTLKEFDGDELTPTIAEMQVIQSLAIANEIEATDTEALSEDTEFEEKVEGEELKMIASKGNDSKLKTKTEHEESSDEGSEQNQDGSNEDDKTDDATSDDKSEEKDGDNTRDDRAHESEDDQRKGNHHNDKSEEDRPKSAQITDKREDEETEGIEHTIQETLPGVKEDQPQLEAEKVELGQRTAQTKAAGSGDDHQESMDEGIPSFKIMSTPEMHNICEEQDQEKNEFLNKKIADLEAVNNVLSSKAEALKVEQQATLKKYKQLQAEYKLLVGNMTEKELEVATFELENEELQEEINNFKADKEAKQKTIESLQLELANLQGQGFEKDAMISTLTDQIKAKDEEINKLKQALQLKDMEITAQQKEMETLSDQLVEHVVHVATQKHTEEEQLVEQAVHMVTQEHAQMEQLVEQAVHTATQEHAAKQQHDQRENTSTGEHKQGIKKEQKDAEESRKRKQGSVTRRMKIEPRERKQAKVVDYQYVENKQPRGYWIPEENKIDARGRVIMRATKGEYECGEYILQEAFNRLRQHNISEEGKGTVVWAKSMGDYPFVNVDSLMNILNGKYIDETVVEAMSIILGRSGLMKENIDIMSPSLYVQLQFYIQQKDFTAEPLKDIVKRVREDKLFFPLCCAGNDTRPCHWVLLTYSHGEDSWNMYHSLPTPANRVDPYLKECRKVEAHVSQCIRVSEEKKPKRGRTKSAGVQKILNLLLQEDDTLAQGLEIPQTLTYEDVQKFKALIVNSVLLNQIIVP